jgi:WD40 repeat protein
MKIKTKTYSSPEFGPTKIIYFDENGRPIKIEDCIDDRGTEVITYSDDGKIECSTIIHTGNKFHRQFNDNGDIIAVWYDTESSKITFELDEHGNVIKCVMPNGEAYTHSYKYSYDEHGRVIHCIDNSTDKEIWYKYDDNGNLIHFKSDIDDYVKRYDEDGREIRIEHANGLIDDITYEYY